MRTVDPPRDVLLNRLRNVSEEELAVAALADAQSAAEALVKALDEQLSRPLTSTEIDLLSATMSKISERLAVLARERASVCVAS